MPLDRTKPPESLLRELREVARDAAALIEILTRGLNFPLPGAFPKEQLIDICQSLVQLQEGTAEGCRVPLDYARSRLPAIRREYITSEEISTRTGDTGPTRGAVLDQKLGTLIASVTTALDEYRRLAAEEGTPEIEQEASVDVAEGLISEPRDRSERLESILADAQHTVEVATKPDSRRADDLRRQLRDARGLNRLALAEIKMPRVVVSWLRKTVDALKDYPELIRKTVSALRIGTDVVEPLVERWHAFETNLSKFMISEWRITLDVFERIANQLDDRRRRDSAEKDPDLPPLEAAVIAAMRAHTLDELRETLMRFEGCTLRTTATQLVFADGTPGARLMLVGEAPGAEEDRQGLPFVGRSGKLLDRMIAAIGMKRSDVYMANIVPWRPPGNRTPTLQEVAICLPFIRRQIELANPDILFVMGRPTMQTLLGINEGIRSARGRWVDYDTGKRTIKALITFHPAYLLRQPAEKRLAYRDFLAIRAALSLSTRK